MAARDSVALEVARATTWTAILAEALERATAAASAGDVDEARAWLLVREFRKPTRFTRPGADATLALQALEGGRMGAKPASAAVRADLLDTYQARLNAALDTVVASGGQGFDISRAGAAALARGYFAMLAPAYEKQRNAADAAAAADAFETLVAAAEAGDDGAVEPALAEIEAALEGFRAAPLSEEEELRRAGQLERFLALVPIEYERGVDNGRVTLDFEIQEAVTFRDGAAQAFGDLEHLLALENQEDTRRLGEILDGLAGDLGSAARHEEVADPEEVQGATDEALELIDSLYPEEWKEAGATADFDVIAATLDRLESGDGGRAVRPGGAGSSRGLRLLRVRAGAAAPRPRERPLRRGGGALLVRGGRPSGPRAARQAEGRAGRGGGDAQGSRPRARRRGGCRGSRADLEHRGHLEHRDHRLPRRASRPC